MRFGVWALAALFVGGFAAHLLLADQGYVLINFRGYSVEMSVPALVVFIVAGYAAVALARKLWRAPRALGAALAGRSARKSGDRLTRGLMHIADGDFQRGERLLTQRAGASAAPLVNYLLAARAAHSQGARERRNDWLKLACEAQPEAEVTVLLTQAQLQYEDGELERALATLRRVQDKEPGNRACLSLLADTMIALDDGAGLVDLLPRLAKAKLPPPKLAAVATHALATLGARADLTYDGYTPLWSALPAYVRQAPPVLRAHAHVLERLGKGDTAAAEIAAALKRDWNEELVRAYGEVRSAEPLKQLRRAEEWLKAHAEDGALLLTAARLAMQNELWGKARSYLESAIALDPRPDAYALYGALLDQLGEREQAALAYHSGLSLASPMPAAQLPALGAPAGAKPVLGNRG